MSATTVFRTLSLDRAASRWEDELHTLTPVQRAEGLTYKRDDLWAPLGAGGINGFKVRQGLWLLLRALERQEVRGIVFAGSVKSTQHAMVATLARYFGVPSVHVLGATSAATCVKHPPVGVAAALGARFDFVRVAYNPVIQKRARDLLATPEYAGWIGVEYGVGLDHRTCSPADLRDYHALGAEQVQNLPADATDLLVPAGSFHAATSVLLGLAEAGRTDLHVHLVGLGKLREAWFLERLGCLGLGLDWAPRGHGALGGWVQLGQCRLPVSFYDLLGTGFTTYQDRWPAARDGIEFHPTYEAKILRWLYERAPSLLRPSTVFWIVGAEPRVEVMRRWAEGGA